MLGRLLLQNKDRKRLREHPQDRASSPCSQDDGWSRENQARHIFLVLPSSLLQPPSRSAALGSGLGQAAPWGSTPGLVQPSLASSLDRQPQICTPHLLKLALVQSPAQGSEGIP